MSNKFKKNENKILKGKMEKLTKTIRQQEKIHKNAIKQKVHEILIPVFTSGQIKKLLHPEKKKI